MHLPIPSTRSTIGVFVIGLIAAAALTYAVNRTATGKKYLGPK